MRRMISWFVLILAFSNLDSGHTATPANRAPVRGVTEGALVGEVLEVKRLYDAAQLKNDGAWFQSVFAEDYVWIGPDGDVVTKAEFVRDLDSRDLTWASVAAPDMHVRVYGDTAIVTGRFFGKGRYKGTPLDERQRFTSVLLKRSGRWRIISEHCSKLK